MGMVVGGGGRGEIPRPLLSSLIHRTLDGRALAALLKVAAVYYLHDPKPPTTAQESGRRGEWMQAGIHLEGKPPLLPPPARVWVLPVPASSHPRLFTGAEVPLGGGD